jgi:AAA15 family ATPase/GTPase
MKQNEILARINQHYKKIDFLYQQAQQDPTWLSTMLLEAKAMGDDMFSYIVPLAANVANKYQVFSQNIALLYNSTKVKSQKFINLYNLILAEINNTNTGEAERFDADHLSAAHLSIKVMYELFFQITASQKQSKEANNRLNPDNPILPLGLTNLFIHNFYNLKQVHISNIPIDTQFIVLTGNNGEGKSNILKSIACVFQEMPQFVSFMSIPKTLFEIRIVLHEGEEDDIFIANQFYGDLSLVAEANANRKQYQPFLIGYGASRLQLQGAESQADQRNRQSAVYGLFRSNTILMNIGYWLRRQKIEIQNQVIDIFNQILPSVAVSYNNQSEDLDFFDKSQTNYKISSEQLSSSNKSIVAIIGDMIIRLYEKQKEISELSQLRGIVLIDEIETHLHPKWQKELPCLLGKLFPNIQFIISTHSPIVFLGLPPHKTVAYNVSKNAEGYTDVQALELDLANMMPHEILTSALFGMDDIRSAFNKGIAHLSVETTPEKRQRFAEENQLKQLCKNFKFNQPSDDKDN